MKKLSKHTKQKLLVLFLALVTSSFFAFREDLFLISKNIEIFVSLYKEININYVDEVNPSRLMQTSIDAMLEDLDPYTEFVPESEIEDYKLKYVSTQYGGIGASVFLRNNSIYISETYEGFPAQKADLRPGDQIIQINGIHVKERDNEDITQMLKGPKNTPVKLMIKRSGVEKPIEKIIVRQEIIQPNVSYYGMIDKNTGYIKLDKFLENSAMEVSNALADIQKNNPSGLILDLRYNGGGILQEAVKIVNLFVEKDVLVVSQKARNPLKTINYKTTSTPIAPQLPLIILINNRSASASEIVAGALQDMDRAIIIGQRSFGKGLVQQTFNLPYNSLVKITIAKYYTPSGRCIQALDYAHKKTNGNVEKIADSLISEYKTRAGRSVYDGSGIYPDIYIAPLKYQDITKTLIRKYHIFDYATRFRNTNANIADPKNFKLSATHYTDFLNYMTDKDYNYTTTAERLLNQFKDETTKENKYNELKPEFETLKSKVFSNKKNDLSQFESEISEELENEIVSRYYFQKGRLLHSFQYDKAFQKAIELITDKPLMSAVLRGEGNYKSIGKPNTILSAHTPEDDE